MDAGLLLEVSRALATQPQLDLALTSVLERLIPEVADWGVVHLIDPGGAIRRVAVRHRDPAKAPLAEELERATEVRREGEGLPESLETGRSKLLQEPDRDTLRRLAPDDRVAELWERLGSRSTVFVPLVVGEEQVGSLALSLGDSGRRYAESDLAHFDGLGAQCALLVENTRLVRQAEQATRERLGLGRLLDAVLAHSPVATAILDPWLRVLHANEAFAELGGLDVASCAGRLLVDVVPALASQIVPRAAAVLDGAAMAEPADLSPIVVPHGEVNLRLSAFPIDRPHGTEPLGVGVQLVDVSDERRVTAQLLESSTRVVLSLGAGGMVSWSLDLRTGQVDTAGQLPSSTIDRGRIGAGTGVGDPESLLDRFLDRVHSEDRAVVAAELRRAIAEVGDFQIAFRTVGDDGEVRWLEQRGRALPGSDGRAERLLGVAVDVTDRRLLEEMRSRLLQREHEARVAAEGARERLSFLLDASMVLARTLDPKVVYGKVPALVVPRFADACVLDIVDDAGQIRIAASAFAARNGSELFQELRHRRLDAGGDGLWSVRRAIRTGTSELVVDITDDDHVAAAVDPDHLEVLRRLDPRSAMVTPLVARSRVLGGITFLATGDRRFTEDDLTVAENLAGRVALAADNGTLFQSRSLLARTLQQTLLPPALPEIPGIELAAVYRVAQSGIDIGGDFYDVFELGDGAWAVVVGDVCGKGPGAAAVTGLFRHTVRAVATRVTGPGDILRATNDAILDQIDDSRFCTAVLIRVEPDPERGRVRVRMACGGHPRPVVIRSPGGVDAIDVSGTLLGVLPEPLLDEVELELLAGDSVLVYTDGVTEARGAGGMFGEARLLEVLRQAVGGAGPRLDASALANRLGDAVDSHQGGMVGDDVAIVVVRAPERPGTSQSATTIVLDGAPPIR